MNLRILAAVAAITTAIFTHSAEARQTQANPVTCFKGDRVSVCAAPEIAAYAPIEHRRHRKGGKALKRFVEPPARAHDPNGNGIVRSHKTGATAHVAPQYAGRFQAYIDDLEANGATIKFMGGYRRGPCWSGGLHPCGKALDVCQLARGVVDRRCNLPDRKTLITIAARHDLTEGGIWCSSDKGHAQIGLTAGPCGRNLYAAVGEFKTNRKHRRHRVAMR